MIRRLTTLAARLPEPVRRQVIPGAIAGGVWLALVLAFTTDTGRRFELRAWDLRCRTWSHAPESPQIAHVDIDDPTFRQIGSWPLPRTEYVRVLEVLGEYEPKVVLFDITFRNRGSVGPDALGDTADYLAGQAARLAEGLPNNSENLSTERLAAWTVLAREFFEDMQRRIDRLTDPDGLLAEQVRRTPGVIVPFNFTDSVVSQRPWFDRAVEVVRESPLIEAPALIDRLGSVAPEQAAFIRDHIERIRQEAAVAMALRDEQVAQSPSPQLRASIERARTLIERRRAVVGRGAVEQPENPAVDAGRIDAIDPPIAPLIEAVSATGYVSTSPDELDGVFRRVPLARRIEGRLFLHAGFLAVLKLLEADPRGVDFSQRGRIVVTAPNRTIEIPVDDNFNMIVNWSDKDWPQSFDGVPFGLVRELWQLRRNRLAELARLDMRYTRPPSLPDLVVNLDRARAQNDPKVDDLADRLEKTAAQLVARLEGYRAAGLKRLEQPNVTDAIRTQVEELTSQLESLKRLDRRIARIDTVLRRIIPGRIVVIGHTMTGSTDLKPTPMASQYPGVGVVAFAMNTILTERFRREADPWTDRLILAVLVGSTVALGMALGPRRAGASAMLLTAGYLVMSQGFFRGGLVLAAVDPVAGVVIAFAATAAYRELTEQRARRHVRRAFEHYVAPALVEQLMDNPELLAAGGRRRNLSVFFADIVGFTAISETVDAEVLDRLVRRGHTEVTDEVLAHGGTHDKFVGDMVMAFFGAPLALPDHALRACRAAMAVTERLARWSDQLEQEGLPRIRMRIGINSGPMIVGNMGSDNQWDFTVLGDAVNTGSRIQDNARLFAIPMMIGETTAEAVREEILLRDLGRIMVKNKRLPIAVFEPVCPAAQADDRLKEKLDRFARGLAAYQDRLWDEAIALFAGLDDGPSRAYLASAEKLKASPPDEAWTGWFVEA